MKNVLTLPVMFECFSGRPTGRLLLGTFFTEVLEFGLAHGHDLRGEMRVLPRFMQKNSQFLILEY